MIIIGPLNKLNYNRIALSPVMGFSDESSKGNQLIL